MSNRFQAMAEEVVEDITMGKKVIIGELSFDEEQLVNSGKLTDMQQVKQHATTKPANVTNLVQRNGLGRKRGRGGQRLPP